MCDTIEAMSKKKKKPTPEPVKYLNLSHALSSVMAAQDPRLTDQDVADAVRASRPTISYLRRGLHKGSQGMILRLWEFLKKFDPSIRLETLMAKESRR